MAELTRSRVGVTTYLIPGGSLGEPDPIAELGRALAGCIDAAEREVCVDLSAVPFVNSEALETLQEAQEGLARIGGALHVSNAGTVLRDVLRITGLDARIGIVEEEAGAAQPPARSEVAGRRIGEILLDRKLVDEATIDKALALQQETGERMAQLMVDKGWLAEKDLLIALSDQLSVPFLWIRSGTYDPALVRRIEPEVLRRLRVLPLFVVRGSIHVATPDPQSVPSMETIEDLTGLSVKPVLACREEILKTIQEAHGEGHDLAEYLGDLEGDLELVEGLAEDHAAIDEQAAGSPVINLINGLIQRAVRDRASDIHIEPSRRHVRIRLRIDGALYTVMTPPVEVHPALISRLKVMANLDIAERRIPQDGRMQVVTQGRTVDLRFSSLPGILGEKVVLRVLDKKESILALSELGLAPVNLETFQKLLKRSFGLFLVTGPTGSGKTTTLYSALSELNSDDKNIVTIEDPVEYQIDTINQNQVRENVDLSFARILKHVLRQDPDIVMVGEIREQETAATAVQAALTGHLVLSTLHTNDSVGAITRLVDMGVEPYLLSSALVGVMAQRLVRRVCEGCKTEYTAPGSSLPACRIELPKQVRLVRGRGCSECYDSGFRGRLAIHEIVESDAQLQKIIVSNPTRGDLERFLADHSTRTLIDDGVERCLAGDTAIEEVLRVVNS